MSIFYLSPVGGEMQLHELNRCVRDRVGFLRALVGGGDLFYSQYLLEGSPFDNVGHFTLHIVASLAGNVQLASLVRAGELRLLNRRLSFMKPLTLRQFARKVVKYITKLNLSEPYIVCLKQLCIRMQLGHIAQHLMDPTHSEHCTQHTLKVPFSQCLSLVAGRRVEIANGDASVPCGLWLTYLGILYMEHLSSRDKLKNDLEVFRHDERIMGIVEQYHNYSTDGASSGVTVKTNNVLLSHDVDGASKYFPPCMKNLHLRFRKHHRLSHDQRFYYTCFLKDIGMPLSEAIKFWKAEYENPSCSSACQHSWAMDGAKFIHGIRHTYGLEGGRKSYSCVGCRKIQSSSGARAEGGCPFKDFSEQNMKSVLHTEFAGNSDHMSRVFMYKSVQSYSKACSFYWDTVFSQGSPKNSLARNMYFSPVKFYLDAMPE